MAFHTGVLTTVLVAVLLLGSGILFAESTNLTIVNNCKETIWPGIAPNNNVPDNSSNIGGGFTLKPGQSAVFSAPPGWNGRIWGRTGCGFDKNGNGTCQTGDCGGTIKCSSPGQPPASIAQFAFGQTDFYDVSLVEGFNLPIVIKPLSGKGNCSSAGCDSDLKTNCPKELVVNPKGTTIACNSACNVYNTDEYCCRSAFSTALTCMPTNYSKIFKAACPAASSFPFDSEAMTTCSATDYTVSFCSSRNQTQCTYHDGKLSCNGSKGLSSSFKAWQILLLVLPAVINLRVML